MISQRGYTLFLQCRCAYVCGELGERLRPPSGRAGRALAVVGYATSLVCLMAILSPHDPIWASEFEELRTIFAQALGHLTLRIEHVGSTAIPDLFAKPILDIDIVIQDYSAFPQIVSALESLGYEHRGDQGIFEREVFKPTIATAPLAIQPKTWMPHHLYVCPASGRELRRHICFRDTLLGRSDLRREYEAMKMRIAGRAMGDRRRYAELKERECREFVERVLEQGEQAARAILPQGGR